MPDLGCSPSAATAFDFLIGKGLRDFQAAAVVGNLQQESRLNPRAVSPPDPKEPSRGIAQWQPPGWNDLLAFAAQSGRDPLALDVQLDFLWHQLQTAPYLGLRELLAATTLEDAVVVFQDHFERPNATLAATPSRISYARSALFACPTVRPPTAPATKKKGWGFGAVAIGAVALATVGYVAYELLTNPGRSRPSRLPTPHPEPEIDYWSRM